MLLMSSCASLCGDLTPAIISPMPMPKPAAPPISAPNGPPIWNPIAAPPAVPSAVPVHVPRLFPTDLSKPFSSKSLACNELASIVRGQCSHVKCEICIDLLGVVPYSKHMYVAEIPNRTSPPAVLLRESFRENGKVKNRTIANLTSWPRLRIEAFRRLLRGELDADRKSTRLNSSHLVISYAVFCL